MKNRMNIYTKKWYCLLLLVFLSACASQVRVEELSSEWIARPLQELKQAMKSPDSYASKIGWQEKTYPLANGYYAFVEPISPDCSIHWSVNQRDIIVDYRAKGSGCVRTSSPSSENNIQNMTKPTDNW